MIKMEQNVTYRRPAGCGGQIISRDHTYLTDGKIIITLNYHYYHYYNFYYYYYHYQYCSLYGHYQPRPHLPNNWEMIFCKHDFKHIEISC